MGVHKGSMAPKKGNTAGERGTSAGQRATRRNDVLKTSRMSIVTDTHFNIHISRIVLVQKLYVGRSESLNTLTVLVHTLFFLKIYYYCVFIGVHLS